MECGFLIEPGRWGSQAGANNCLVQHIPSTVTRTRRRVGISPFSMTITSTTFTTVIYTTCMAITWTSTCWSMRLSAHPIIVAVITRARMHMDPDAATKLCRMRTM